MAPRAQARERAAFGPAAVTVGELVREPLILSCDALILFPREPKVWEESATCPRSPSCLHSPVPGPVLLPRHQAST